MRKAFVILIALLLGSCKSPSASEEQQSDISAEIFREKGRSISKQTFETLSSKLMQAVSDGGVVNAVQYCNLAAYPLTDSLARANNAVIRRAALRYRNPQNQATTEETALFEYFSKLQSSGADLSKKDTAIVSSDNTVLFAKPILLQPQCVACHGKIGEGYTAATDSFIKTLYPEDRATGFAPGDLRAIWSIRFKAE